MTLSLRPIVNHAVPTHPGHTALEAQVIVGNSDALRDAVALARKVAAGNLPILLVGETGTGKEVLAKAIHQWSGRRGRLVSVDCGTLADGTIVGELMGHRRGAYTGAVDSSPGLIEQAEGGSLFLDEIGSLSLIGQAPLLRVLETKLVRGVGRVEDRKIDFRPIATAHENYPLLIASGKLRHDLLHRLAGVVIRLPPLRERVEDIHPLATHFAALSGAVLSHQASQVLAAHQWTGNIRELRFAIERAIELSGDSTLTAEAVAQAIDAGMQLGVESVTTGLLVKSELSHLCALHGHRATAIAAALGISRATLFRRLAAMGLSLRGLQGRRAGRERIGCA
ncbi:MAG TPA: sigma 54-interacting transcriptional regulator [Gemmatimonadales bacterium]|nr:sigma 54-interacting transcriptional regulator [Gemmatimonadales bacterium]